MYREPDFSNPRLAAAPECRFEPSPADTVLPDGFMSTTNHPTYGDRGFTDEVDETHVPEAFSFMASEVTTRERAEALRTVVRELQVPYQDRILGPITVSLGVAIFPDQGLSGQSVLRAADAALYQSKAAGRDRVTSALQIAG